MIGAKVKRREDRRLLTGRGRYVDDVVRPGLRHAAIVRSPHAHAAIRDVLIWPLAPDATGMIVYGNFMFSTGPNTDAGGRRNTLCHMDIPMRRCSVSLDGRPMTVKGDVVAAGQRV